MFCVKCGKEIQEGNSFCIYCGEPIEIDKSDTFDEQNQSIIIDQQQRPSRPAGKLTKRKKILILILAIEIIVAVALVLLFLLM